MFLGYCCCSFIFWVVIIGENGVFGMEYVFKVVGVDFIGFIKYRKFLCMEGKVYLVLFVCCLIRVLYLEVWLN